MTKKIEQMNAQSVEKFLYGHGVKPTPQRMVIAQFVLNTKAHPTADQIFQEVANKLPVLLSRATVYNTLNTLVAAGALKEVYLEAGPARYDANVEEHHHFVDVKTGQVFDIDSEKVASIASELGPKFKVHHYSITFFGELQKASE